MSIKKILVLAGALIITTIFLAACAGPVGPAGPAGATGPAGPQGPAGAAPAAADLTCTKCHNDTSLITGKLTEWETSKHGTGTAYLRGTSKDCAGCHSGAGFSAKVAAGLTFDKVTAGDPNPTRQDCRACHQIHTTYTETDFALETTAPVTLVASGKTFDMGKGNLCANCHQPRTAFPAAVDGMVDVASTHWGPHHGPESAILMGTGGALVEGTPAAHYTAVKDGCVTCHMGADANHTFLPAVANCVACHADAKNFDVNGVQTAVKAKADAVKKLLVAKNMLTAADGLAVVGKYPEAQAAALWNYITVVNEDASFGVHNAAYINALLDQALAALK